MYDNFREKIQLVEEEFYMYYFSFYNILLKIF